MTSACRKMCITMREGAAPSAARRPISRVRRDTLTAEGKVVKAGSTIGYVECDVSDSQGRLVARAACTCLKLKAG